MKPSKPALLVALLVAAAANAANASDEVVQPWAITPGQWEDQAEQELRFPLRVSGAIDWDSGFYDPQVTAAQLTARSRSARSTSRFTRSRGDRSRFSTAALRTGAAAGMTGLASVPFMIGDTGAGTCLSFNTIGYVEGTLSHPSLTCSRLNISENNRAYVSDRLYYSYRHFENSTPVRLFQGAGVYNLDRHTLGMEKTFSDGLCSLEVRVPIDYRLPSNPVTRAYDLDPPDGFIDPETFVFFGDREVELANMSAIFKVALAEHEGFLLSGGLGITAPTAKDVQYQIDLQNVGVYFLDFDEPFAVFGDYLVDTHFNNETWYLSPFLAWSNKECGSRWFHQGFMQVEIAANPMSVHFQDLGSYGLVTTDLVDFIPEFGVIWTIDGEFTGDAQLNLHAQPIMRLSLGEGYYLVDQRDHHSFFDQLVAMAELHYTTTLKDAKLSRIPLDFIAVDLDGTLTQDAYDPVIGSLNGRVDILNAVLGLSATVNGTVITNGFTMPLRGARNRGFDFEYNLQIQRPF